MKNGKKWIRLVGAFSERNFGDDLLMIAGYEFCCRLFPDACISIAVSDSSKSDYVKRWYPDVLIEDRFRPFPRSWDYEIYAGGTQFYSFPSESGGHEAESLWMKLKRVSAEEGVRRRLARVVVSRFVKAPRRFAVGIGIGPFESGNEEASRAVLSGMKKVWVRDEEGLRYPRAWGFSSAESGADWCFASGLIDFPLRDHSSGKIERVGVVVRGWSYATASKKYFDPLLAQCDEWKRTGVAVSVFSFCEPADSRVIDLFRSRGFDVQVWDPEVFSTKEYLKLLVDCDFLASARFHGVVVGALLGIPSVGISVDPKVRQICAKLDLDRYVWGGGFLLADLGEKVGLISSELDHAYMAVAKAVNVQRDDADIMLDALGKELAE